MRKALILPSLALVGLLTMGAATSTPLGEEKPREAMAWNVDTPHTEINFSVKHFFTPVTGTFNSYDVKLIFDAEAYPEMTFESTSVRQVGPDQLVATGNLTIKETTQVASFRAATQVDRREFEVGVANWAQTMIVGGDVAISISLEANHN